MSIYFWNTLTKRKDELKPVKKGVVSMYHCGPTVYNYAHIGNIISYIFADTIRRVAEYNGYKVNQVINITDFGHIVSDADSGEDKMMTGLKREGLPVSMEGLKILSSKYTDAFVNDLKSLNIKLPTHMPLATEHINEYIKLIEKLFEKSLAYDTETAIYFDTEKIDDYGRLGGLSPVMQSRLDDKEKKRSPRDFALWKKSNEFGWKSPWGQGFPGWHIECSAMSMKYLGDTFDIHTGGIDHIPVHHNNEIAQSEHATGKPFANIWMHKAFVTLNSQKIAKSTGNTFFVKDLTKSNVHPLSLRYWTLLSHYKTETDFTIEAVKSVQTAFENLVQELIGVPNTGNISVSAKEKFLQAVNDDLNTPEAIAIMWNLLKDNSISIEDKKATIFDFDQVLGLGIKEIVEKNENELSKINTHISNLLERRKIARERQDWAESDQIRDLLKDHGFVVRDTNEGQKILLSRPLFA